MRAAGPICRRKTAPRWGAWVQAVSERPLPAPHPFKVASGEQSWCPGNREEPEEAAVGRAEVGPLPLSVSSGGRASGPRPRAISGSP